MSRGGTVNRRGRALWTAFRVVGALVAYGGLACFLYLVGTQVYRWIRDGEWVRIGVAEGLHSMLVRCCVQPGDSGRLAALAQWLASPSDWLGLHKVFEVVPASLGLFLLSVAGNWLLIYGTDRDRGWRGEG